MASNIKLSKLVLESKQGGTLELSLDEARDLHQELSKLFDKEVQYVPYSFPVYYDTVMPRVWSSKSAQVTVECGSGLSVSYAGYND